MVTAWSTAEDEERETLQSKHIASKQLSGWR
jgi:hypothetical protein